MKKEPKLIIVGGMSGSGKSTTSKKLAKIFNDNNIKAEYYHEEMDNHPIRWKDNGEFTVGDLKTYEGMKKNIDDYFKRWNDFIDEMLKTDHVYVMEGCLFQLIMRYFYNSCFNKEDIKNFYMSYFNILKRIDATLVFLYPESVKATLQDAFEIRGERWKKLILDPNGEKYFETHPYKGEESIYKYFEDFRSLSLEIFNLSDNKKLFLKVPPIENNWNLFMENIAKHFELKILDKNSSKINNSINSFPIGVFFNLEHKQLSLELKRDSKGYFLKTSWWKRMDLSIIDNKTMEAVSFPIKLIFEDQKDKCFFKISGGDIWESDKQTFYNLKK